MPDFGPNDPLTAAIQGRGGLYNLSTATQPGQNPLDQPVEQTSTGDDLEGRRKYLIQQLPYANRRNTHQINSELRAINSIYRQSQYEAAHAERQAQWEANQRRLMAHDQAEMAAKLLKQDRETSIDEQGAALMTGLGRLDAMHRNGRISPEEYDAGLLDLGQQNQLGLHHPVAGKMFEHFITESDKRNQFNVRRLTSETAKLAARYGVEPQVDPDTGLPSLELTKSAALQTDKGKAEIFKQMNDEMLQKYGVPTGVNSLFNPIEPHSDAEGGKSINLPFLDKEGKIGHLPIPKPMFEQMKSDFNDRYFSIVPPKPFNQGQTLKNASTMYDPDPASKISGIPGPTAVDIAKPQASGLQVGTQRNVGGVNYSWNGTRWEKQ